MLSTLANPARFMALSRPLAPALGAAGLALLVWGLWLGFHAPPDYQQGDTVLIMFVHVPAAYMGLFAYLCLGAASFAGLVWRHALADAAAKAAAPLGAGFAFLALLTGSLWGKPMWGAWWVWGDARLMSVLILFLLYVGYLALRAAIEDESKAARAASVLALVGLINVPIVHFSVQWWNTLHQGPSVIRAGGSALDASFLRPLLVMAGAYTLLFLSLWLVRIRAEVWRRRALSARRAPAVAVPGLASATP